MIFIIHSASLSNFTSKRTFPSLAVVMLRGYIKTCQCEVCLLIGGYMLSLGAFPLRARLLVILHCFIISKSSWVSLFQLNINYSFILLTLQPYSILQADWLYFDILIFTYCIILWESRSHRRELQVKIKTLPDPLLPPCILFIYLFIIKSSPY